MTFVALPPDNTYSQIIAGPDKVTGYEVLNFNDLRQSQNSEARSNNIQIDSIKIESNTVADLHQSKKSTVINFLKLTNSIFLVLGLFFLAQTVLAFWGENLINGLYSAFIGVGFLGLFRVFFRAFKIIKNKSNVLA